MIKKIKVDQLKPGIFVHDFNCGWLHHPFLRNRVMLKSDDDIEKVLKYKIREVYIDTDHGLDVDDAPTKKDVEQEIQIQINHVDKAEAKNGEQAPLAEELIRAEQLLSEAKATTHRLLDEVRLGKQLDLPQVNTLVDRMTESVLRNKDALVSLARIKSKDEYTYLHSLSVSTLCIAFGQYLKLDARKVKALGVGGLLHDIGKVKVPEAVLNKPDALSEEEFEIMKEHVRYGDCILRETTHIEEESICVTLHHHERLDGTGYPAGLKADEISLFGQMAAVVDIYDALVSERCYKGAMLPTEALRKLFEWSNGYLNRRLVEQFIAQLGIYPVGALVRLRSGLIALVVDHGEKSMLSPVVRAIYDTRKQKAVSPFDLDLSKSLAGHGPDEIVSCESPEKWRLQPEKFLFQ